MVQDIYIIDDDESSILVFKELFKEDTEYKFISVKSDMIEVALKNIPSMIIINEDAIDMNIIDLCKKIRNDDDNTITPVIVVSSNDNSEHRIKILQESIEYYIKKPVNEKYLYYTVKNVLRLLAINRRISPLTGLPGNVQIHAELKKRIARQEPPDTPPFLFVREKYMQKNESDNTTAWLLPAENNSLRHTIPQYTLYRSILK